jgi:hypothetical protein
VDRIACRNIWFAILFRSTRIRALYTLLVPTYFDVSNCPHFRYRLVPKKCANCLNDCYFCDGWLKYFPLSLRHPKDKHLRRKCAFLWSCILYRTVHQLSWVHHYSLLGTCRIYHHLNYKPFHNEMAEGVEII